MRIVGYYLNIIYTAVDIAVIYISTYEKCIVGF